jgi:hypothetical protein
VDLASENQLDDFHTRYIHLMSGKVAVGAGRRPKARRALLS